MKTRIAQIGCILLVVMAIVTLFWELPGQHLSDSWTATAPAHRQHLQPQLELLLDGKLFISSTDICIHVATLHDESNATHRLVLYCLDGQLVFKFCSKLPGHFDLVHNPVAVTPDCPSRAWIELTRLNSGFPDTTLQCTEGKLSIGQLDWHTDSRLGDVKTFVGRFAGQFSQPPVSCDATHERSEMTAHQVQCTFAYRSHAD